MSSAASHGYLMDLAAAGECEVPYLMELYQKKCAKSSLMNMYTAGQDLNELYIACATEHHEEQCGSGSPSSGGATAISLPSGAPSVSLPSGSPSAASSTPAGYKAPSTSASPPADPSSGGATAVSLPSGAPSVSLPSGSPSTAGKPKCCDAHKATIKKAMSSTAS